MSVVPLNQATPFLGQVLPPPGGSALRARGLRDWREAGMPSHRTEAWRGFPFEALLARGDRPGAWSLEGDAAGADDHPTLGAIAGHDGHPLVAANSAGHDLVLEPRGGRAVLHIDGLVQPRLLIAVPAGESRAIELTLTGGGLANLVIEADIARGGRLDLVLDQALSPDAALIGHLAVRLAADARFAGFALQAGATIARLETRVALTGSGADCALAGATIGRNTQHLEMVTSIDHLAPRAASRQTFKSVLDDRARGVFKGKVTVARNAVGTDAHQLSRALLLSRRAMADGKPELEIWADDVKCSHGSTMGEIEADQMFYLRARGIGVETARRLLVRAFLEEAFGVVADPSTRARLDDRLTELLP